MKRTQSSPNGALERRDLVGCRSQTGGKFARAAFRVAATMAGLTVPGLRGPILGGIGFGLASLCRPSLLPCSLLTAMAALAVGPGHRLLRPARGRWRREHRHRDRLGERLGLALRAGPAGRGLRERLA